MSRTDTPVLISLAAAQAARNEPGRISALMLRRGTLELRYYVPPMPDPQLPHTRDELYVVAQGKGNFVRAGERVACGPGDVLFVPANVEHRFVDCSPGFAVWVMFYGPKGGERD
jgi:mannose-6-phosphate isomerase-like protein (cupin superfamily)